MITDQTIHRAWQYALGKVEAMSHSIGADFPHAAVNGRYDRVQPHFWTAGFWPGMLWLAYKDTGNTRYRELAWQIEQRLDQVLDGFHALDHDVGFMWILTAVASYKLTGNADSRRRALTAASHLLGRLNCKGGYIRAWNDRNDRFPGAEGAIIDCTMNLALLYWASAETGDPRFRHGANLHADTVLKHFIREDGSVRHVVCFDPETGVFVKSLGGQGYSPESAWSRGAAWAIYGLAISFRYTGELRYLQGACKAADFFIAHLPEDGIPDWDFRAPRSEAIPKDSSAAAIAAGGLLELARTAAPANEQYREAAEAMLNALFRNAAVGEGEALLAHGTGNWPANKNVGAALIYGDYYYMEALGKVRGNAELFW